MIINGGKIKVRSNAMGASLASPSLPLHMAQGDSQLQVADWESVPQGSGILRMHSQPNAFQGETDIWVEMNTPEVRTARIRQHGPPGAGAARGHVRRRLAPLPL